MAERALVVIPTYNEAVNLPLIVPQILAQDPRLDVLVVDDNSPDGTGRIADEMAAAEPRIHVLHRPGKGGPGEGLSGGLPLGAGAGLRVRLRDGRRLQPRSHGSCATFSTAAQDADLVIGSRYKTGVNVINWPISRLLLSLGANQYARWVTGLPVVDSTGGFKCFRRRVLEAIDFDRVRSNGYSFQIEMSFRAWKKGFRLVEIPIVFTDRVEGQSKMNKRIVREAIWMVWWLRLKALAGQL